MNNKKHILLSITGGSPAVLTETLYGIYKNNLQWPDEIQVITTQYGEKQLRLALFEKNEQHNNVIEQLCADYGIENVPYFSSEQVHIVPDANNNFVDDARSEADQEALADYIVKSVAQLCDDSNNTIHASISGGRKTMTFYLGYAMTLFARQDDILSHVLLTDPQYEISDFYYPTPYSNRIKNYRKDKWLDTQSTDVDVVLSKIPFIRQREIMSKHVLNEFSKTDVLGLNETHKNDDVVMSYADLVTYQSIAQILTQLEYQLTTATMQYDKLDKKLSNLQQKQTQFLHDKLMPKAEKADREINLLKQQMAAQEQQISKVNTQVEEQLAKFNLEFNLANKTIVVQHENKLNKIIDFSNNELELAYYAMIARQSTLGGYKLDTLLENEKNIVYGYLFILELLRIQNINEQIIADIHQQYDIEDNVSVAYCMGMIFNNQTLCHALQPYQKSISSLFNYGVEDDSNYDADTVNVESVGIDKAFLRDRKSKLNGLINKTLCAEFNGIIAPTGVWNKDQQVNYYRGRSNPNYSDGLWVTSNLME